MRTQGRRLLKVAGVTLFSILAFIGSILGIGYVITFDNDAKIYERVSLGSDYHVLEDLFDRKPEDVFDFENGWSIISYFDPIDRNMKQLAASRDTDAPHDIYDAKVFLVSIQGTIVAKSIYGEGSFESIVPGIHFALSELTIEQLERIEAELEN